MNLWSLCALGVLAFVVGLLSASVLFSAAGGLTPFDALWVLPHGLSVTALVGRSRAIQYD